MSNTAVQQPELVRRVVGDASTIIDWRPLGGRQNWLFGTAATKAEWALVWAGSIIGVALTMSLWWITTPNAWSWWQVVVAAVIGLDVVGGAVANAGNAIKRTYGTHFLAADSALARLLRSPITFTAFHVHPILIGLLFPGFSAFWGVGWYTGILLGVIAITQVPLYLRRPVAMLVFVTAVGISAIVTVPAAWVWFIPLFLAKLVLAHAVREEPYRPAEA